MTLDEYILGYQKINKVVNKASDKLQKFERDSSGLVVEKVRLSEKYKKADLEFKVAFKNLQNYNVLTRKLSDEFRKVYGRYVSIMDIKVGGK